MRAACAICEVSRPLQSRVIPEPIYDRRQGRHRRRSRHVVERQLSRELCAFTNNIPQRDGGTHMAGFRGALTRHDQRLCERIGHREEGKSHFTGDDAREGLTCVLSVKVPDPKFSSQTKDKLCPPKSGLRWKACERKAARVVRRKPAEAKRIVQQDRRARSAREAARKARELTRARRRVDVTSCPAKLATARNGPRNLNSSWSRATLLVAQPSRAATRKSGDFAPAR